MSGGKWVTYVVCQRTKNPTQKYQLCLEFAQLILSETDFSGFFPGKSTYIYASDGVSYLLFGCRTTNFGPLSRPLPKVTGNLLTRLSP